MHNRPVHPTTPSLRRPIITLLAITVVLVGLAALANALIR